MLYAQSWAFAHLLFFGHGAHGAQAVNRLIALIAGGQSSDEAFNDAFGGSHAQLDAALERYVRAAAYRAVPYPRIARTGETVAVARASSADVELAKGALLFGSRDAAVAEPHIRRATELAPNDTRAWELLGYVAFARNDFKAANAALSRAAAFGSTSSLVYYNLGVSRQAGTVGTAPGSRLDPKLMNLAAADFRRAIELMPTHIASYEALAGMIYSMETLRKKDVALLERGRRLAPDSAMIEVGIAAAEIRLGLGAQGRRRLESLSVRSPAPDDVALRFAQQILDSETFNTPIREIDQLVRAKRFAEALERIDRALHADLDPAHRQTMTTIRQRAADFKRIADAVETANTGNRDAATRMLAEIVASLPEKDVVDEAVRVMGDLLRAPAAATR